MPYQRILHVEISVLNKFNFFKKLQFELRKLRVARVFSDTIKLAPRTFFEITLFAALTIFVVVSSSGGNIEDAISSISIVFAAAYRMVPQASNTVRSINTFRTQKNTIEILHDLLFRTEKVVAHDKPSTRRKVSPVLSFAIEVIDLSFRYPGTSDLFQT